LAAACGGENPYEAAQSETGVTTSVPTGDAPDTTANEFLPENQNVTNCIGAVERPNCGSNSKGGWRLTLTFAILIAGMGFIGWRVARSVRARDTALNDTALNDTALNDTALNEP